MRELWGTYLDKANVLIDFTARVIRACHAARVGWLVENPASRRHGAAAWAAKADCVSLWDMPEMVAVCSDIATAAATFPQCAYGSPFQKYTTLLGSRSTARALAACIGPPACTCRTHAELAIGERAAASAAYPPRLCQAIVDVIEMTVHDAD